MAQLHFGGGTPTMLEPADFGRLLEALTKAFPPTANAEMSVEIDPVVTRREHLAVGRQWGLNRLSIGVQDFSDEVQRTVERLQSVADAERVFADARDLGYLSVNVDLMYGLPTQTPDHLRRSVHRAVEMGADRLAIFGYAHVPWMKPHQKKLQAYGIPGQRERWQMATAAREVLMAEGFVPIGMDHFARPTDELAVAAEQKRLWRNFQGYTVLEPCDLAAIGVTSIGDIGGTYLQNVKRLSEYHAAIDDGRLPVEKGAARSAEDDARRQLINSIMCNLFVDLDAPLWKDMDFSPELGALAPLADDDLLHIDGRTLTVTERGRVFVRNIASVFDTYLGDQQRGSERRFSQSV
jgi:oxygen-independent coproporphyrinogen-3 oxidase